MLQKYLLRYVAPSRIILCFQPCVMDIEQGLAIGIIPGLIADLYSGSIKKITLYPPAFRELGIALPKDVPNSAAVNRFIELAMECIAVGNY